MIIGSELCRRRWKSLEENDAWELLKLPEGMKSVGSKWVFKTKMNAAAKLSATRHGWWLKGFLINNYLAVIMMKPSVQW